MEVEAHCAKLSHEARELKLRKEKASLEEREAKQKAKQALKRRSWMLNFYYWNRNVSSQLLKLKSTHLKILRCIVNMFLWNLSCSEHPLIHIEDSIICIIYSRKTSSKGPKKEQPSPSNVSSEKGNLKGMDMH